MSEFEKENTEQYESHNNAQPGHSPAHFRSPENPGRKRRRDVRILSALSLFLAVLLGISIWLHFSDLARIHRLLGELRESEYIIESYRTVVEAAEYIKREFIGETDAAAIKDGAIRGMIDSLDDTWSYYVPAQEYADYLESTNNEYVGIGVSVTKEEGAYILVEKVTEDSPAAQAGIVPGDMICEADGLDLRDISLDEAKTRIRGPEGTFVKLKILRGSGKTEVLDVERRSIIEQTVKYAMLEEGIGYIQIYNFGSTSADSAIDAAGSLLGRGAAGLIFDVRFNGGGKLTELLKLLDYLLPEGDLFVSEDKQGEQKVYTSDAGCVEVPMAVLVNDSSYSAAEFFAAALQEYGWASVVGQHTTGKGYSQVPIELSDGSAIILSTRRYLTPNRVSLANRGITPDIELEVSEEEYAALYYDELDYADDSQLQAAIGQLTARDKQ